MSVYSYLSYGHGPLSIFSQQKATFAFLLMDMVRAMVPLLPEGASEGLQSGLR